MRHSTLLTEFTDISQRLEYLVAHSSQMVFITGEEAAVQQGFVEAFLGQQSRKANIAFMSARRGKSEPFYRQKLAEQLDLKIPRNQSLAQAFAARDNKAEAVLIAITCAENLPEDVLRELWDLVLQNRFARNGEQVNILMFGEHEWAEEVKTWLPTNNNDKPVLLTTQTLEYDEETEVEGDLDEMIANRRKLFQQRMQARADEGNASVSLLHSWWFRLVLVAVFLVCFSSILLSQCFDLSQGTAKEFVQFLFQSQEAPKALDGATEQAQTDTDAGATEQSTEQADNQVDAQVADLNQRVAASFSTAMQQLDEFQAQKQQGDEPSGKGSEEQTEPVEINSFVQDSADSADAEFIADISTEQLIALRDTGKAKSPTDSDALPQSTGNVPDKINNAQLQGAIQGALNELDALAFLSSGSAELSPQSSTASRLLQENNPPVVAGNEVAPTEDAASLQANTAPDTNLAPPRVTEVTGLPDMSGAPMVLNGNKIDDQAATARRDSISTEMNTQVPVTQATAVSPSATLQEPSTDSAVEISSETFSELTGEPAQIDDSDADLTAALEQQNNLTLASSTAADVEDYQVEDVVTGLNEPVTSADVTREPETGETTFQYHEPRLLELANDSYVLQVSGISTEALLEEFLLDNRLINSVWVYKTRRYGGDWYVVLVKQNFASLPEARAAVSALPGNLQAVAPFAKAVSQVREEILSASQG